MISPDHDRLRKGYAAVRGLLLAERTPAGHWVGELSTSALSTATAVMALEQVRRARARGTSPQSPVVATAGSLEDLIARGVHWLLDHQNADGGWGDTVKSFSNISTTMLCRASLAACAAERSDGQDRDRAGPSTREPAISPTLPDGRGPERSDDLRSQISNLKSDNSDFRSQISILNSAIDRAAQYIDQAGGIPALVARYGKDKTFSVPILTHCALAGLVDWRRVPALPFELACIPARFYKTVRLPVVSYALPALVAIGQVRHHFAPTWNPITRLLRNVSVDRSLRVLERIQPPNGGFLEATPLTSFVTMSLAAKGLADHPVVRKGVEFIANSVRPDGSWPIDTNLATWVTTLSVNALGDDLPEESRVPILRWLLDQQYKDIHPYTNADPGGWAWTDLPGGVPDADDTSGAILALANLPPRSQAPAWERTHREAPLRRSPTEEQLHRVLLNGLKWLSQLQNRDGGIPTFCRGWGTLPFDRSSSDLTAHALRACSAFDCLTSNETISAFHEEYRSGGLEDAIKAERWNELLAKSPILRELTDLRSAVAPLSRSLQYLQRTQLSNGSWLPLWFGNQHASDDANPTYGTAKVLMAYRDCGLLEQVAPQRGFAWLRQNQNPDGGWGAGLGTPSSVEETALATEALLADPAAADHARRGVGWLLDRIDAGTIGEPAPIGFYFAKLWYFERLYPLIFTVSCLRRAVERLEPGENWER